MRPPSLTLPALRRRHRPGRTATVRRLACAECGAPVVGSPVYERLRVCESCGHHHQRSAREAIQALLDPGSFRETDAMLGSSDPLRFAAGRSYPDQLLDARQRTGEADALVVGTGRMHDREVVVAALDFAFLGGSMGSVVGEKLARAADRAAKHRVPLVTVSASGGARMQEGMVSLLQMAKCAAAVQRLRDRGGLHVAILSNPTTGGVFASYASLADVVLAEPRALIGFAGPRVAEAVVGHTLPAETHTAEFHLGAGTVDATVDRRQQRWWLGALLAATSPAATHPDPETAAPAAVPETVAGDAWDTVVAARDPQRPTARAYLDRMLTSFVELHGDRLHGDDPSVIVGFGLLGDRPVAVAATERLPLVAPPETAGRPLPEGFRKATRLVRLADRLGLPIVTLVDTPGAWPGVEAEERGLGVAMAELLAAFSAVRVPTVALVVGEGGSGGALAFAACDRVLMQERAIFSVIAPEGAAAILFRDVAKAPDIAEALAITAPSLLRLGIVDEIVLEPDHDAARDADEAARLAGAAVSRHLAELGHARERTRLRQRERRYRTIGSRFVVPTSIPSERRSPVRLSAIVGRLPHRRTGQDSPVTIPA